MYKTLYLLYGVIIFSSCCMNAMDGNNKKVGIGGAGNNSVNIKSNKAEKKLTCSPYPYPSSGGNHCLPFKGNITNKRDELSEH